MTRKKTVLCMGLLTLVFYISLFAVTNSKVESKSYQTTLNYGDYYHITSRRNLTDTGSIEWSFTGSSNSTGIEVWIYDDYNFTEFQNGSLALGYLESDGSSYLDSGTWDVLYNDRWTVVFIHNQLLGNPTDLSIVVNFDRGGLKEFSRSNCSWYPLKF